MPPQVARPDHKSFQRIVYPWLQVSLMHAFDKLDPLPTITYPYLPTAAKRPGLSFFLLGTRFYETFEARLLGVTGQDVMVCIWGSKAQDSETIGDAVLNYGLEWHPDDYIDRFITNLTLKKEDGEPVEAGKESPDFSGLLDQDFGDDERESYLDKGGDDEFSPIKKGEQIKSVNKLQTLVMDQAKWNPGDEDRFVNLRERLGVLQNMWNYLDGLDLRADYGDPDRTIVDRNDYADSIGEDRFDPGSGWVRPGSQRPGADGLIDALQDLKDSIPHFPFGIVPRNMFDMLRPGLPDLGVYERVVLLNITKSQ